MTTQVYAYVGILLIGLALFVALAALGANPSVERAELGLRGLKRHEALERSELFRGLEPFLRFLAGFAVYLPVGPLRERIALRLQHAGDYLGLTPNEYLGLNILSITVGAFLGTAVVRGTGVHWLFGVLVAVAGALLPSGRLNEEIEQRRKQMGRGLPAAIDLASMCMSAGLDFQSALRQITIRAGNNEAVVKEEFERILQLIELGHTRKYALQTLAERIPTEAVRDFVAAAVQGEEKGTALAEVLQVQARMLRMRRAMRAEEVGSQAGIKMMIPMALLFGCIMIILLAPLMLTLKNAFH